MGEAKLSGRVVDELFRACLYETPPETIDPSQVVDGIKIKCCFDPVLLKARTEQIEMLLDETHPTFRNGWSFLNFCFDKHDEPWTGLHVRMEQLMMLGMAIGRVQYCTPREAWSFLPGGLPYFIVQPRGGAGGADPDRFDDAESREGAGAGAPGQRTDQ